MKYCKECKFVKRNWIHAIFSLGFGNDQWRFAKCSHIKAITKQDQSDAFLAKEMSFPTYSQMYCTTMRGLDHLCGEEAKYYEEKDVKNIDASK